VAVEYNAYATTDGTAASGSTSSTTTNNTNLYTIRWIEQDGMWLASMEPNPIYYRKYHGNWKRDPPPSPPKEPVEIEF
jgi:hypothetical protein